jgi:hypothetical protein
MELLPAYPLPLSESQRLQALRPYQLYSTMDDESFSELVRLAAKLFRVPISIIAFVEAEEAKPRPRTRHGSGKPVGNALLDSHAERRNQRF